MIHLSKVKLATSVAILLLIATSAMAQNSGWQVLPNIGLPSTTRFEDVYFTDTSTGYAVYLANFFQMDNGPKPIYKTTDGGTNWTCIGPAIYGSSALRSIEFLDDKTTGIAGTLLGSLYRTTDAGANWTEISAAIVDSLYPDTNPAGTKKICGIAHYGNTFYAVGWWGGTVARVYKSTDMGVNWTTTYIDSNICTSLVDAVFLSQDTGFVVGGKNFSDQGSFLASSDESVILRTTNGGATWTKVFSDTMQGGRIWKIQALDHQTIVGAVESYYYTDSVNMVRSIDGGNTWTMITAGKTTYPGIPNITQGIGFATKDIGWLGGYYDGVFQTTNGGQTWDTVQVGTCYNRFFVIDSTHVFAGGAAVYKWSPGQALGVKDNIKPVPTQPHMLSDIFPNPAKGKVQIAFDLGKATNVLLQVVGIDSRHHATIAKGQFTKGHYSYTWDATNMPPGHYLVWLGTDDAPIAKKFVLVK